MIKIEGNLLDGVDKQQTVSIDIQNGKIHSIKRYDHTDTSLPVVLPGFIDVHVHGGGGADTMDASEEAFETIATTHARYGTTSLLLTTVTETVDRIQQVLQAAKQYRQNAHRGANVIGVHLEGPFIHPEKTGAQNPKYILPPDESLATTWFESGVVRMMTMAPDCQGAPAVARRASQYDIIVSAGHTMATKEDMAAAAQEGFSHVTHLCNAMPPILHREVGPIGYMISNPKMTGDLICDGVHLDESMVKMLVRAIGTDRLLLITDAIRCTTLQNGIYELGGLQVELVDGVCRLHNGTLAGSVLTMSEAVRRVQSLGGISLYEAQMMASFNPARKLGLSTKGQVAEGFDADLVAIDASGHVAWTMVGGNVVPSPQSHG